MAYSFKGFARKIGDMARVSNTPYVDKIADLNKQVNEEARKLQKLQEGKDNFLKDFSEIVGKKARLLKQISALEQKVLEEKDVLGEIKDTKRYLVNAVKVELKQETEKLKTTNHHLAELSLRTEELESIVLELSKFIDKNKEARQEYLTEKEKLENVKKENIVISTDTLKKSEEVVKQNKQLDDYRQAMIDWSGRLTTGLHKVREATKELNERLDKEGIPVVFDLPPEQKITVPFE